MAEKIPHAWRLLAVLASLILAGPASAQSLPLRDQAYLRDAVRLADVLGAAHGVRYLCNGPDDQYWRGHMIELLNLEAPQRGPLRSSMVRAFNDSFSAAQSRYRVCDSATVAAEAELAAEGRDLADRLAEYYFPRPR